MKLISSHIPPHFAPAAPATPSLHPSYPSHPTLVPPPLPFTRPQLLPLSPSFHPSYSSLPSLHPSYPFSLSLHPSYSLSLSLTPRQLLPLSPSLHPWYSCLLAAPQTHPACSGLQASTLTVPSLKLFFQMSQDLPLTSLRSWVKCHLTETFLHHLIKEQLSLTLTFTPNLPPNLALLLSR